MTPRRGSCPLLLFSLVGFLMTCVQEPGADGQNTTEVAEKAGICPQAGLERPNGNCTEECQSDARCKGNQKCCRTGCGTSCRIPDDTAQAGESDAFTRLDSEEMAVILVTSFLPRPTQASMLETLQASLFFSKALISHSSL
uniref:WAP domain-containing protein n=1 Tax=Naja naja TaxID=35670 RepID=A0A8C6Y5T9_NAJNA